MWKNLYSRGLKFAWSTSFTRKYRVAALNYRDPNFCSVDWQDPNTKY